MSDAFERTPRNRVRRRHERGAYDRETIYRILDSSLLCHIAYVVDGQPYCTPTAFWREGDTLYWHGSSASRMVREQSASIEVCLTVSHMDSLVLARCAFGHSINYRSAMVFGRAQAINDPAEKRRAADAFVDRVVPGRSPFIRPASPQELKATTFLRMPIDAASAKVRDIPVTDEPADLALPVWAGIVPLRLNVAEPAPCPEMQGAESAPGEPVDYASGDSLDNIMQVTHRRVFGDKGLT